MRLELAPEQLHFLPSGVRSKYRRFLSRATRLLVLVGVLCNAIILLLDSDELLGHQLPALIFRVPQGQVDTLQNNMQGRGERALVDFD
jgi:hypothetical protein